MAERGKLFSLEDDLTPNSVKADGISFSRFNMYLLREVEKLIADPQEALDTYHAYGKLQRGLDYERGLSPVQVARLITGLSEKPMATLIRS